MKTATHTTEGRTHLYRISDKPANRIQRFFSEENHCVEFWDHYQNKWMPSHAVWLCDLIEL